MFDDGFSKAGFEFGANDLVYCEYEISEVKDGAVPRRCLFDSSFHFIHRYVWMGTLDGVGNLADTMALYNYQ